MKTLDRNRGKYDRMDREGLTNEIAALRELHAEVVEERYAVLWGTTGLHRNTAFIAARYEAELGEIQKCIDYAAGRLETMD